MKQQAARRTVPTLGPPHRRSSFAYSGSVERGAEIHFTTASVHVSARFFQAPSLAFGARRFGVASKWMTRRLVASESGCATIPWSSMAALWVHGTLHLSRRSSCMKARFEVAAKATRRQRSHTTVLSCSGKAVPFVVDGRRATRLTSPSTPFCVICT